MHRGLRLWLSPQSTSHHTPGNITLIGSYQLQPRYLDHITPASVAHVHFVGPISLKLLGVFCYYV